MASKQFLKAILHVTLYPSSCSSPASSRRRLSFISRRFLPVLASQNGQLHHSYDFSSGSVSRVPNPVSPEEQEDKKLNPSRSVILKRRLEEQGIDAQNSPLGHHSCLTCPKCEGGESEEKTLSLFITNDGSEATWNCFNRKCWTQGGLKVHQNSANARIKEKPGRKLTVESLELEPVCEKICDYFATRMITRETLARNRIMQKQIGDEILIAFTYWQREDLVGCKYRSLTKRFSQEKSTKKIFYGLDDMEGAEDIIIVEGEIDKLAMEEAGFRNCVSVPDGAPCKVSTKKLPSESQDTAYKYLWNCKDYLNKVSRIILATDGDGPGEALAEELVRRLGRDRCWRIKWPKNNEFKHFKDANEVLMYMGPQALKETIENADPWEEHAEQSRGISSLRDLVL